MYAGWLELLKKLFRRKHSFNVLSAHVKSSFPDADGAPGLNSIGTNTADSMGPEEGEKGAKTDIEQGNSNASTTPTTANLRRTSTDKTGLSSVKVETTTTKFGIRLPRIVVHKASPTSPRSITSRKRSWVAYSPPDSGTRPKISPPFFAADQGSSLDAPEDPRAFLRGGLTMNPVLENDVSGEKRRE